MRGYTIIELLIVLTIISLIFVVGYVSFRDFSQRQAVVAAARSFRQDLLLAQESALSGKKPSGCDVLKTYDLNVLSSASYRVDAVCANGAYSVKSVTVASGIGLATPPTNPLSFKVLGEGTNLPAASDQTYELSQENTNYKQYVIVNYSGKISGGSIASLSSPLASPVSPPSPSPYPTFVPIYTTTPRPTWIPTPTPGPTQTPTPIPTLTPTPTPAPTPLGAVAYWKMDEGAGVSVADFADGINGVANSAPIVVGKRGNARSFSGSPARVIFGSTSVLSSASITVSFWARSGYQDPGFGGTVMASGIDGADHPVDGLIHISSGGVMYRPADEDGNSWTVFRSNFSINSDNWHNIVISRSGLASAAVYIDGVAQSVQRTCGADCGGLHGAMPTYLGFAPVWNWNFVGILDEVVVWNRVLSASEVSMLFNSYQ